MKNNYRANRHIFVSLIACLCLNLNRHEELESLFSRDATLPMDLLCLISSILPEAHREGENQRKKKKKEK